MSKFVTKLVAALTLGSAVIAAVPAEARDWRGDRGYSDRGRGDGFRGDRGYRGDRGFRGYRGGYGRSYGYGGYGRGYYGYGGRGYYAPRYGYGYGYAPRYGYYGYDRGGDALVAGIAGLAIGAAIAGNGY